MVMGECPIERLGGRRVRERVEIYVDQRRAGIIGDMRLAEELLEMGFTRPEAVGYVRLVQATDMR